MKYWLFDGNDVVGPFSPQELSARAGFSAASMVVPEAESENQNAWQMATAFPDFQFDEDGHPIPVAAISNVAAEISAPEIVAPEKIEEPAVEEPVVSPEIPAEQLVVPERKEPKVIQSIPLAEPIHLAEAPAETILLSRSEEEPGIEAAPAPLDAEENAAESSAEKEAKSPLLQAPEETIYSTCTLPLAQDPQTTATLPTVEEAARAATQPEPEPFSADLEEPVSVRETVKPRLESNTQIDDFLQKQQAARRPNREKAKWMLWVLLLLLIPGLVALAMHWGVPREKKVSVAPTASSKSESANAENEKSSEKISSVLPKVKSTEAAKPAEVAPASKPAKSAQPTTADQAIEIVKNYALAGNKETIAAYFGRLYKKELSSGYNEEWSAEPLHKNIYIVKYRLTKTRQEPIVYVFQADASKNKLTGALNNVALDLIGKI